MNVVVEKTDTGWVRFSGLEVRTMEIEVSTCTITYGDGRVEADQPCPPYKVQHQLSPMRVQQLVDQGLWTQDNLSPYGLKLATEFAVPEGKRTVGAESFVEENGAVSQVFEVEDIPPPEPEPELTVDQRIDRMLGDYGVTREQMLAVIQAGLTTDAA
ncbi:MAG: hypothetical protein EOR68_08270 [Mesorhizobium sp.]|uniref:hypothetical protein n=1 Tax=Mesorhizobium sp. TaxID=1871066 RepID=UPI000FE4FA80|nr:hypothetical protein [Mesorhizobium sp.]RWM02092.1 MAG: hypothetical protein EOR68_08270 [Mesorhizobium sp.]